MKNAKISIIVPIYNAEKTINRCIDSVLKQTYTNFELIIINDGSLDKSDKICENYARKDSRIQVIHKKNGGVSSARNIGINLTTGEYITFIDSDDYILEHFLEHLISVKADLVVSGFKDMPHPNGNETYLPDALYKNNDITTFLNREIDSMLFKSPWGKLFKTDLIRKNNLSFDENISFGEDSVFMLQYLCLCTSIAITSHTDYRYFVPTFSKYQISHSNFRYTIQKKIFEFKKLKEIKKLTKNTYLSTELHSIVSRLLATEINKKYTITGYKEFKQTCYLPEFSYINRHKGGRLFRLIILMMQHKITLLAFLILRFIYPLTLINSERKI